MKIRNRDARPQNHGYSHTSLKDKGTTNVAKQHKTLHHSGCGSPRRGRGILQILLLAGCVSTILLAHCQFQFSVNTTASWSVFAASAEANAEANAHKPRNSLSSNSNNNLQDWKTENLGLVSLSKKEYSNCTGSKQWPCCSLFTAVPYNVTSGERTSVFVAQNVPSTLLQKPTPLIIISDARSGGHLLFDMIEQIRRQVNDDLKFATLPLDEFFNIQGQREQAKHIFNSVLRIKQVCSMASMVEETKWDSAPSTDDPDMVLKFVQEIKAEKQDLSQWPHNVIKLLEQKYSHPEHVFYFLSRIPFVSEKPYIILKIMRKQMVHNTALTPQSIVRAFVDAAHHNDTIVEPRRRPKFIILWRRRVIEQIVSYQIARQTNTWWNRTTDVDNAVFVKRKYIEKEIDKLHQYYIGFKEALLAEQVDFDVVEYSRDLSNPLRQIHTMKRLVDILGLINIGIDIPKAHASLQIAKQAQVPVEKQVKNWHKVVEWGYGGGTEEWTDWFSDL